MRLASFCIKPYLTRVFLYKNKLNNIFILLRRQLNYMRNREYSTREIDRILSDRNNGIVSNRRYSRRSVLASEESDKRMSMEANPVFQQIAEIAEKHGYELREAYLAGIANEPVIRFNSVSEKFKPEIYYEARMHFNFSNPMESTFEGYFKVQTAAYGALSINEYSKLAQYVINAYEMLKELETVDISKLAHID